MPTNLHTTALNAIAFAKELLRIVRTVQVPALVRDVVQRMREERMAQAASSLTFTTLLALVPLVTVAMAVFSTLPVFDALRKALEDLGPIFVKFGQVLSTRRDLMPPDIADELALLQDRVPSLVGD